MKLSNDSSALILSHFNERSDNAGFPPQLVRDYLLKELKTLVYIEHAFPHSKDTRSSMRIYENGKVTKTIFTPSVKGPQAFFYLADILITWAFLLNARKKYNICVALDNLNTVSVLPFKLLKNIEILVYYTIDYTPHRFPGKILNSTYHLLDKISCYYSDAIWILAKRMETAREKNGVNLKKSAPSILLPMGADTKNIKILPINKINKNQLVFVGHLLEKQGIQIVMDALPSVVKDIKNVKLVIVGHGAYKDELVRKTRELGIQEHVEFKGFVENYKDVEEILKKSAVGIAPYIPEKENYTYYTDPGKPKLYLACGLPVIITDVPESARIIENNGAGICIPYKKEYFEKAIIKILKDDTTYNSYRENAVRLSKQFDMNILISNAIEATHAKK